MAERKSYVCSQCGRVWDATESAESNRCPSCQCKIVRLATPEEAGPTFGRGQGGCCCRGHRGNSGRHGQGHS